MACKECSHGIVRIGGYEMMCKHCSIPPEEIQLRREIWLQKRATSIGASDAAAILEVSQWGSALETWARKTGVASPDLDDPDGRLEAGLRVERFILEWYAEIRCREVRLAAPYSTVTMPNNPILTATPDAYDLTDNKLSLIEIKTAGDYAAKYWRSGPPLYYQVQVQDQLMVTGEKKNTLVVAIGYHRPQYWDYSRNEEFIAQLQQKLTSWYTEHISKGVMPEPNGTIGARNILKIIHPKDTGKLIHLPSQYGAHWERLEGIKEDTKKLEAEKILLSNQIKALMGDAAFAMLPDGKVFKWKTQRGGRRPFLTLETLPENIER